MSGRYYDCDSSEQRQRGELVGSDKFGAADAVPAVRERNLDGREPASRDLRSGEGLIPDCASNNRMAEDSSEPSTEADGRESQPVLSAGFDTYRSLTDSSLMILVAKDVVPPFRFKAGGWEFLQSSIELGSAMKARIAEKGFFMFRVKEDRTGGVELNDLPSRSQSGG